MIYLGSRKTKDRMLELLRLIFKENVSAADKKERLNKEYQMDLTSDMEEELTTMCNLSEGIADRAEARIIINLWRKGSSISFIEEVSGWSQKQILAILPKNKVDTIKN